MVVIPGCDEVKDDAIKEDDPNADTDDDPTNGPNPNDDPIDHSVEHSAEEGDAEMPVTTPYGEFMTLHETALEIFKMSSGSSRAQDSVLQATRAYLAQLEALSMVTASSHGS